MNIQPIEKTWHDPLGVLKVHSIFDTIQGEGPLAGKPAVFVRLAGCNLQCVQCDTDYTSKEEKLSPPAIIERIKALRGYGLVVFTGGEPLRQNLVPLIKMLLRQQNAYTVQIETNGTYCPPGMPWDDIHTVCSPKTPGINPGLMDKITAFKYVLQADHIDERDGLPTSVLGANVRPARPSASCRVEVFVQPCDEFDPDKNKRNTDAAVRVCMKHGYSLTLQMHKILQLP